MKAATFCNTDRVGACRISIHAAREGGDLWSMSPPRMPAEFQSTPPVKAATFMTTSFISSSEFQSTPPVKAATENIPQRFPVLRISIHAAREGGDIAQQLSEIEQRISIHAAREGGDIQRVNLGGLAGKFQSTPPVKAATRLIDADKMATDISIHAAREGGDFAVKALCFVFFISIHAAREGGDRADKVRLDDIFISIHAAREGGDCGNE